MKKIFLVSLGLASAFTYAIDGGHSVPHGTASAVVKLSSSNGFTYCTGTLVAPNIVLTAAHCVERGQGEQNVSYAGDREGQLKFVFKKEFTVKSAIYREEYFKLRDRRDMIEVSIDSMRSRLQQKSALKEMANIQNRMTSIDIAFLILDRPQKISKSSIATVSCNDLPQFTAVTLMGYGKNAMSENRARELQEGTNILGGTFDYTFFPEGGNMANSGDSGSPLFKKDDTSVVYGVASNVTSYDGITVRSDFASTSSFSSKELYRLIQEIKTAPQELKDLVKKCI